MFTVLLICILNYGIMVVVLMLYPKNNFKGDYNQMENTIKFSSATIVTIFFAWLIYYLALPAANLTNPAFWWYLIGIGIILTVAFALAGMYDEIFLPAYISGGITVLMLVILMFGAIAGTEMFSAHKYQTRLDVENTTFSEEFTDVSWNSVPQIDKDSSVILGKRKMGTLTSKVSQFNVLDEYTIINYNSSPVRVSPLGYVDFFKYQNNKINGIPGYILVNGVTKEAEYVELEEGMRYSTSAFFEKDLKRYLRHNFGSTMFGEFSFELDDKGTPYWIVPTYKYSAGIGGAKTPTGCITVNSVSGKLRSYSLGEIPEWIDSAIVPSMVVSMIDTWGMYGDGFWNTVFGQQGVKKSTEGYNFVTIGNDVYLYTGITSVVADESNIGFILVNMRTSKAKYFELDSAEEYSAMDSAKGQVQHLNYTATFPILISVDGVPTYFLSLKDNAGLVKMYAFVSVQNIQQVSVTDSSEGVEVAMNNYKGLMNSSISTTPDTEETNETATVKVQEIHTAIIDGNTHYYIIANDSLYVAPISINQYLLPVLKNGDTITITYYNMKTHNKVISLNK